MENLTNDSLRLVKRVLSDNDEDYIIVHIGQTHYEVFSFPASPEIPTCYGYFLDRTPNFLVKQGILMFLGKGYFAVQDYRSLTITGASKRFNDLRVQFAEVVFKKFTKTDLKFSSYSFYTPEMKNINPQHARALHYVVIDRKKAEEFITNHTKKSGSIVNAAERFVEKAEEREKTETLQSVPALEARIKVLEQQNTKVLTPSQIVKEILKQFKFPKMQKNLIKKLDNTFPKDTKVLKGEVGTGDLPSLKRDTRITIKKYGLGNIIDIKSYKGSFDKHFYQLEVKSAYLPQVDSNN